MFLYWTRAPNEVKSRKRRSNKKKTVGNLFCSKEEAELALKLLVSESILQSPVAKDKCLVRTSYNLTEDCVYLICLQECGKANTHVSLRNIQTVCLGRRRRCVEGWLDRLPDWKWQIYHHSSSFSKRSLSFYCSDKLFFYIRVSDKNTVNFDLTYSLKAAVSAPCSS